MRMLSANSGRAKQADGRTDGEAVWRAISQRPSSQAAKRPTGQRDLEVWAGGRAADWQFYVLSELWKPVFFVFFFSCFMIFFSYCLLLFFRSLVLGLGLCYNFSPCRRPLRTLTFHSTRGPETRCLFEKCFWNFNKLVTLNGRAHLSGVPTWPTPIGQTSWGGGSFTVNRLQRVCAYRWGILLRLWYRFGNYLLYVRPTGSAAS